MVDFLLFDLCFRTIIYAIFYIGSLITGWLVFKYFFEVEDTE